MSAINIGKKKLKQVSKKKDILTKEREDNWYVGPCNGIPVYKAETDPNCPAGQMKKFNDDKKLKAKLLGEKDKRAEKWANASLENKFQDVPLRMNPSLRYKAMEAINQPTNREALAEVEILQKIIVREGLLNELNKLMKSQNDISACLSEIVELVKALRYQTLDILEDIGAWQQVQISMRPFLYKGLNYVVKIKCDLDFLDLYDEITEKFCFEFKNNPLAYRDGGNIITGYDYSSNRYSQFYPHNVEDAFVDGIEITRLRNAEKIIQNEFNRLAKEKSTTTSVADIEPGHSVYRSDIINKYGEDHISNDIVDDSNKEVKSKEKKKKSKLRKSKLVKSTNELIEASTPDGSKDDKKHYYDERKVPKIFNTRKIKLERIQVLKEEASELKAMMAHLEDKNKVLQVQINDYNQKRKSFIIKMKESQSLGKEVAAQHIAAEISVVTTHIQELVLQIKDLQREGYFINLERKRKLGVMQKLKDELQESKRRESLKKQIEERIKKEGLVAVLGAFNKNPVGMSILGNQGSSINSSITSNFSDDRGNKTNIDEKENPINHDIENDTNFEEDFDNFNMDSYNKEFDIMLRGIDEGDENEDEEITDNNKFTQFYQLPPDSYSDNNIQNYDDNNDNNDNNFEQEQDGEEEEEENEQTNYFDDINDLNINDLNMNDMYISDDELGDEKISINENKNNNVFNNLESLSDENNNYNNSVLNDLPVGTAYSLAKSRKSPRGSETNESIIADTVELFFSVLTLLKVGKRDVQEIKLLMSNLMNSLVKITNLSDDYEGILKINMWLKKLYEMQEDKLQEGDSNNLIIDLDQAYNTFDENLI